MKAVIDRIENNIIILVLFDNNRTVVQLPDFLFPGAGEGDLVDIVITLDEAGTTTAREYSRAMVTKLDKKGFR